MFSPMVQVRYAKRPARLSIRYVLSLSWQIFVFLKRGSRLFSGRSIEIYWMGGRKAITKMWNSHNGAPLAVPAGDWRGGMSVWNDVNSSTAVEVKSVKVRKTNKRHNI